MKRPRWTLWLLGVWIGSGIILLLSIWTLKRDYASPDAAEEARRAAFLSAYLQAREQLDARRLYDLFHLEGVDGETRRQLRLALEFEIDLPVKSFRFLPPGSPRDWTAFYQPGRQELTLTPRLRAEVVYETQDDYTVVYLLGLVDGQYRIVFGRLSENA